MDFINYSLTNLIVFLGIGVGISLAYIAPEELKDGKRYFILLQNLLLPLILFFLLFFYKINLILNVVVSLVLFLLLFFYLNSRKNSKIKYFDYALLGIVFYLSIKDINLFLLESALIFIYGFPTGSLLSNARKKNVLEVILKNISFVVVSLGLFLLFAYIL